MGERVCQLYEKLESLYRNDRKSFKTHIFTNPHFYPIKLSNAVRESCSECASSRPCTLKIKTEEAAKKLGSDYYLSLGINNNGFGVEINNIFGNSSLKKINLDM